MYSKKKQKSKSEIDKNNLKLMEEQLNIVDRKDKSKKKKKKKKKIVASQTIKAERSEIGKTTDNELRDQRYIGNNQNQINVELAEINQNTVQNTAILISEKKKEELDNSVIDFSSEEDEQP